MDYTATIEVQVTAESKEEAAAFAIDDIRDGQLGPWAVDVSSGSEKQTIQSSGSSNKQEIPSPELQFTVWEGGYDVAACHTLEDGTKIANALSAAGSVESIWVTEGADYLTTVYSIQRDSEGASTALTKEQVIAAGCTNRQAFEDADFAKLLDRNIDLLLGRMATESKKDPAGYVSTLTLYAPALADRLAQRICEDESIETDSHGDSPRG